MIDGSLYSYIYTFLLTGITIHLSMQYSRYPTSRVRSSRIQPIGNSIWLLIFIILFIGLRPLHSAFVDMWGYNQFYQILASFHTHFRFNSNTDNLIFDNLFHWMAKTGMDVGLFFLLIAIIYFYCMWLACRRWFPNDTLYAFVIYLSAFSTFSYGTNGIKAGAAASIFMLALSYCHQRLWLSVLLAFISWGFHHSMHVVLIAYGLVLLVRSPKYYIYGYLLCVILSVLRINPFQELMLSMTDEKGEMYLISTEDWGGKTGFRIDFLLYSIVPIVIGCYTIFKLNIRSAVYNTMFNLYVSLNAMWVLSMYAAFNNRIAYLSWFLLPIVSIYPMMKLNMRHDQYRILNMVVWLYLGFKLFSIFFM